MLLQYHVDAAVVRIVVVLVIAFEACNLTQVPAAASYTLSKSINAGNRPVNYSSSHLGSQCMLLLPGSLACKTVH